MDNCKDLMIFMNEINFLLDRINGNVIALNQVNSETNTENLREIIRTIEFRMFLARMQMDSMHEDLELISKVLERSSQRSDSSH